MVRHSVSLTSYLECSGGGPGRPWPYTDILENNKCKWARQGPGRELPVLSGPVELLDPSLPHTGGSARLILMSSGNKAKLHCCCPAWPGWPMWQRSFAMPPVQGFSTPRQVHQVRLPLPGVGPGPGLGPCAPADPTGPAAALRLSWHSARVGAWVVFDRSRHRAAAAG